MSADQTAEQRRLRILLGILAGVVVLAAVWFFVLAPGDDDPASDPAGDAVDVPSATDDLDEDDSGVPSEDSEAELDEDVDDELEDEPGADDEPTVETFDVYLGRDPFEPQLTEESDEPEDDGDDDDNGIDPIDGVEDDDDDGAGDSDDGPNGGDDGFDDGDGFDGGDGSNGDGNGDDPNGDDGGRNGDGDGDDRNGNGDGDGSFQCAGGDAETVCGGQVITIERTGRPGGQRAATVAVDGDDQRVREGETFGGGRFLMLEIDVAAECVLYLYGDESRRQCVDDSTLK